MWAGGGGGGGYIPPPTSAVMGGQPAAGLPAGFPAHGRQSSQSGAADPWGSMAAQGWGALGGGRPPTPGAPQTPWLQHQQSAPPASAPLWSGHAPPATGQQQWPPPGMQRQQSLGAPPGWGPQPQGLPAAAGWPGWGAQAQAHSAPSTPHPGWGQSRVPGWGPSPAHGPQQFAGMTSPTHADGFSAMAAPPEPPMGQPNSWFGAGAGADRGGGGGFPPGYANATAYPSQGAGPKKWGVYDPTEELEEGEEYFDYSDEEETLNGADWGHAPHVNQPQSKGKPRADPWSQLPSGSTIPAWVQNTPVQQPMGRPQLGPQGFAAAQAGGLPATPALQASWGMEHAAPSDRPAWAHDPRTMEALALARSKSRNGGATSSKLRGRSNSVGGAGTPGWGQQPLPLSEHNLAPRPAAWREGYSPRHAHAADGTFSFFRKKSLDANSDWIDLKKRTLLPVLVYNPAKPTLKYDMRDSLQQTSHMGRFSPSNPHALLEEATSPPAARMRLYHTRLPWYIDVASKPGSAGVSLYDLLFALHTQLDQPVSSEDFFNTELGKVDRAELTSTWTVRCRRLRKQHLEKEEREKGLKRIDFLGSQCLFVGLVRNNGLWEIKTVSE
ncbi:unnamed protein product [Mycena citricolor]|uniref:DUF6699 domain-containing protein n=1 Tax=Mycena citricolor TaxID=2018698 RepID=A0AAD2H6J9_9AGAR|nr:unnamed protein product [Mycena citricolor]